jgi:hypothetical protein
MTLLNINLWILFIFILWIVIVKIVIVISHALATAVIVKLLIGTKNR